MQKERVFIFVLVGLMLFSAVATALYFVAQDTPTNDSAQDLANETQEQVCRTPSTDIADYQGNPSDQWPVKLDATNELKVTDLKAGDGQVLVLGQCISVHYRLALADGTPVEGNDTFKVGSGPISFEFVEGGLIKGWTEGLVGMKVGGVRRLVVPPQLGYAETAREGIPANSTLVFDVELVKIEFDLP